jgi:hypothetical protein
MYSISPGSDSRVVGETGIHVAIRMLSWVYPSRGRPNRSAPQVRSIASNQSIQNWKRMPTVGSIEDLCRKPFARPFDTCDHMMPA